MTKPCQSDGILAIDPGDVQTAFVLMDKNLRPAQFGIVPNDEMMGIINEIQKVADHFAIEMVASYGMAVGKTVFETVFWIGRFWEQASGINNRKRIYRKDVKMNLCKSMRAKDGNIRQALIDRFGVVGVRANKGWFYGFKKDLWQAYAVGVTYYDTFLTEVGECK